MRRLVAWNVAHLRDATGRVGCTRPDRVIPIDAVFVVQVAR